MNKDQATEFVKALGGKVTGQSKDWVRGPCVLAPWRHKSGKDSSPSFGVRITSGQKSYFHCYSCESGGLDKLLQTIEFHAQQDPGTFHGNIAKAREILEAEEVDLPVLPAYQEYKQVEKKEFVEFPEYWLTGFPPVEYSQRAVDYLIHRGITYEEALAYNLRYDTKFDRIMFPYRDVFGRLAGARGRAVELPGEAEKLNRHYDYSWGDGEEKDNNAALVWYNEQALDVAGSNPIVVVEGQVDLIVTRRVYPHVMANLTAKPVPDKMDKLVHASGVILMNDGDQPGYAATEKYIDYLVPKKVPVFPIYLPYDPATGKKSDPALLGTGWISQKFSEIGLTT